MFDADDLGVAQYYSRQAARHVQTLNDLMADPMIGPVAVRTMVQSILDDLVEINESLALDFNFNVYSGE